MRLRAAAILLVFSFTALANAGEIGITLAPVTFPPDVNPLRITDGPDGKLWFIAAKVSSKLQEQRIGSIDDSGTVLTYPLTTTRPTIDLGAITTGPDGNLWVTYRQVTLAGIGESGVARVSTSGQVTFFVVTGNSNPGDAITTGPDGNLWFVEASNNYAFRVTPQGAGTKFTLPSSGSFSKSITAGPDGNLWFPLGQDIVRLTTSGVGTAFPAGASGFGIAAGADGNLWFTAPSKVGRITPTGQITMFPIPTTTATRGIAAGPDGNIWFAEADARKVGQLVLSSASSRSGNLLADGTAQVNEKALPSGFNRLNEIEFKEHDLYINASDASFGSEVYKTTEPVEALPPDIAVKKEGFRSDDQIYRPGIFIYRILVQNVGAGTSGNVVLKDVLPAGFDIFSTQLSVCDYDAFGRALTCALGTFGPGQLKVVEIGGTLSVSHGILRNEATAFAERDTNPANNVATHEIDLDAPSLTITKHHDLTGPHKGWWLHVTNAGIVPTNGAITVTDSIPAGVAIDIPYPGQTTASVAVKPVCTQSGGTLNCTINEVIPPGKNFIIRIPIETLPPGGMTNVATVKGGGAPDATSEPDVISEPDIKPVQQANPALISGR